MQPMARPGFKAYPEAEALRARRPWLWVCAIDACSHLLLAGWLLGGPALRLVSPVSGPWVVGTLAIVAAACALGCMGLRPKATNWRRRVGVALVVAALWRGGPLDRGALWTVAIVLWQGVVWIGSLVEGRRVTRAIVDATGEEGLGDDPSRHV